MGNARVFLQPVQAPNYGSQYLWCARGVWGQTRQLPLVIWQLLDLDHLSYKMTDDSYALWQAADDHVFMDDKLWEKFCSFSMVPPALPFSFCCRKQEIKGNSSRWKKRKRKKNPQHLQVRALCPHGKESYLGFSFSACCCPLLLNSGQVLWGQGKGICARSTNPQRWV